MELWRSNWLSLLLFYKLDILSVGAYEFLDNLISFIPELSLSWNSQLVFQNFILNKSFSNRSKTVEQQQN